MNGALRAFVLNRMTERERWWSIIALFFIIHVVLALPILTPNLKDIGSFDEAAYIVGGRFARADNLPSVSQSPITRFFFALTYIPVDGSDFWLIHSCTIGRFVLFVLLWVSSYMIAKQIPDITSPLIMIGFLSISPAFFSRYGTAEISLVINGSHALFAISSTFALAQIISFHRRNELTNLWIASLFVSLAVLSRMGEGTVLAVTFITLSILLGISTRRVSAVLAAATIPFVVIVGGYMLIYLHFIGKSPLGTGEYFYQAFEQGHGLAYHERFPGDYYNQGQIEARRLFGTQEQNQDSVVTAIQRNPKAYLERVPRLAKIAVGTAIGVYGGPLSVWVFLLAFLGCIELARKKQFLLLCILLFWPSYLLIHVLLVFQPTHLLLPFAIVFCLASIGLTSLVSLRNAQRYLWSALVVGSIVLGIARDSSLGFISSAIILLVGSWIVWIILNRYRSPEIVNPFSVGVSF
jgi:hypothetical protein